MLNRLRRVFPEEAVFRIDHFLHKQTLQNVLGLRFANRLFETLWARDHVEIARGESLTWRAGPATTTTRGRRRTWCRTTCSAWSPWSRP